MIELRAMTPADLRAVRALRVAPSQTAFVDPIETTLGGRKDGEDCHVVIAGDQDGRPVVGFFIVDRDYATRYPYAAAGDLGLQEYFIDREQQGRGYGKAAMLALPGHVTTRYPDRRSLVLTVNCRNPIAYRIYRAAGFVDREELYHGGPSGPQHVLRLSLER